MMINKEMAKRFNLTTKPTLLYLDLSLTIIGQNSQE